MACTPPDDQEFVHINYKDKKAYFTADFGQEGYQKVLTNAKKCFELEGSSIVLKTITYDQAMTEANWDEALGKAASYRVCLDLKLEIIA